MKNMNKAAVLWTALILALVVIAVTSQIGSALPVHNELKPPLKFVERPQTYAPGVSYVPAASQIIMTETFGTSFVPTTTLTGSTPLWRVMVNPDDSAGYYWDRVTTGSYANSAWHATKPITSSSPLVPGSDPYPAGQDTWLLYGPVDLSRMQYVQLTFQYSMAVAPGDLLMWSISTDGQTFYGDQQTGSTSGWLTNTYSLKLEWQGNNSAAYLAFAFKSGVSPNGLGAFIRNVKLAGEPFKLVYLPVTLLNYPPTPTPTPSPTPYYGYTFDPGNNDINLWGGTFTGDTNGFGGPCKYGQFERTNHGNPIDSLAVWNSCKFVMTSASPNVDAPTNFEMIVDISPWRLYGKELYGVIFNANGGNFYRLSLATNTGNSLVTSILLERCSGGSCKPLTSGYNGLQGLPANLVVGQSLFWDQLRVLRVGSNIKVFINGVQVIDLNDGTLVGPGKFGVQIFPQDGNVTTNPPNPPEGAQMQIDFDNIRIYQR